LKSAELLDEPSLYILEILPMFTSQASYI